MATTVWASLVAVVGALAGALLGCTRPCHLRSNQVTPVDHTPRENTGHELLLHA